MEAGVRTERRSSLFFSFVGQHKWKYIIGIVYLFFINLLQLIVPKITGDVIDKIQAKSIDGSGLLIYSGIILLIALLVFALNYLSRVELNGAANMFDYQVRNAMFQHLERLSARFFNKKSVGEIMALSINDIGAVRMALGRGIMLVANTLFLLVSSIFIMSRTINIQLTLIVCIPFPFLIFIMTRFGKVINKRFRKVQESFADLTRKSQENIAGIRVIKAFSQEEEEIRNFDELNKNNYIINMQLVKVQGVFFPLITFISSISYLIVLVYGGILVINKSITLGDFVAFNSYIGIIVRPIGFIGMIINFISRGRASMGRLDDLFQEKPDVYDEEDVNRKVKSMPEKLKGCIEFRDLTFSYDAKEKPVLKDINLTIPEGKTVGIIGKVGSGKSTLVSLLLRLYNPGGRGRIYIDDMDIMDIPLKTLRNAVGYVPQDNFLFSSKVKENIAFVPEEINFEKVEEAAEISQVYDNIMEFPNAFDTMLGERGVNLSGGQKQRISIARALIKDPPILILDDCLSAVDTNTEERILEGLKTVRQRRTCLMIAHRISTIKDADEIIVMDKGRIIEKGTHEQLLDLKGFYYRMYERQLLEDKIINA